MNKYLEKIAYVKGFQANRLGIRAFGDALGWDNKQKTEYLLLLRQRAKERAMRGGRSEMDPGFAEAYAKAYSNRHKKPLFGVDSKQDFEMNAHKRFPNTNLP